MEKVVAQYALVRCVAFSAVAFGILAALVAWPLLTGRFDFGPRSAGLWPMLMLGATFFATNALALQLRALTFGGRAIAVHDGVLTIYYPFGRKNYPIQDISSAWASQREIASTEPSLRTGYFKLPSPVYVAQVSIGLVGGKTVNIATRYLVGEPGEIAADVNAAIGPGGRSPAIVC